MKSVIVLLICFYALPYADGITVTVFDCPAGAPVSVELYIPGKDAVVDNARVMPVGRTASAELNKAGSGRYRVYVFSDTDGNSRLSGKEKVILSPETGGTVYAELSENSTLYLSFKDGILTTGNFDLTINDIEDIRGSLSIGLFRITDGIPGKKMFRIADFPVEKKNMVCRIPDVPYGEYAVSLFHDINMNSKADNQEPSLPSRESSESHGTLSPDAGMKYRETVFLIDGPVCKAEVSLKYGFFRTAVLSVQLKGLKNTKGQVLLNLFSSVSQKGFPADKDKAFLYKVEKLTEKNPVIVFENVPFGMYAVGAVHDEDSNFKINTNLFGVPREGNGASNDAKGRFGPPSFEDASFAVDRDKISITINIAY